MFCNKIFNITESSTLSSYDLYSKSKIESDLLIQDYSKKNYNDFSFTILRIANVFSYSNNPKSFRLINYLLMKGIWFNCSNNTNYHFIHAKDIAFAVLLCILNLQKSKNKIYIVSDDINQLQLHKIYAKKNKSLLFKIPVPLKLLELIIKNISLPSIILNFLLTISSQVIYDNNKIKKELNYKILYSLKKF